MTHRFYFAIEHPKETLKVIKKEQFQERTRTQIILLENFSITSKTYITDFQYIKNIFRKLYIIYTTNDFFIW